jgi:hypothetical protein
VTESESSAGLMVLNLSVSGVRTARMVKENLSTWTGMSTTVSGLMIKQTVLEFTSTSMALCTRVNGKTTFSMAAALRLGQIRVAMKETMHLDASTELEAIAGMMAVNILVTGVKIRLVGLEFTRGSMAEDMKVSG